MAEVRQLHTAFCKADCGQSKPFAVWYTQGRSQSRTYQNHSGSEPGVELPCSCDNASIHGQILCLSSRRLVPLICLQIVGHLCRVHTRKIPALHTSLMSFVAFFQAFTRCFGKLQCYSADMSSERKFGLEVTSIWYC